MDARSLVLCLLAATAATACAPTGDDGIACERAHTFYVKRMHLPRTPAEADRAALDLDRDGLHRDNGLGFAIAFLDRAYPGLADRMEYAAAGAAAEIPMPSHFRPYAALSRSPRWSATRTPPPPPWSEPELTAVDLRHQPDDAPGRLGLALAPAQIEPVIRALAFHLDALAKDGDPLGLDRNEDGSIDERELGGHPYVRALLLPEIELDGEPRLSFALEVAAH